MNGNILFDSHCHLQDGRLKPDLAGVMRRALDAGVGRMLCCATSPDDWPDVLRISTMYDCVIPAFGVHPWFLDRCTSGWQETLEKLLVEHPGAAVGEIGIDHGVVPRKDTEQDAVFIAQLRLARKYHRPVSLHCRKAWKRMGEILDEEGGLPDGGVIHSYSGSAELVAQLARLGCSFSFGGAITRSFNRRGITALKCVLSDRLMVETDAPDMVPEGVGVPVNEPANLVRIVAAVAHIRGVTINEACRLTYRNAARVFCGKDTVCGNG